jgi:hypothetical protein
MSKPMSQPSFLPAAIGYIYRFSPMFIYRTMPSLYSMVLSTKTGQNFLVEYIKGGFAKTKQPRRQKIPDVL